MRAGLQAHRAGRLPEAVAAYRRVLEVIPGNPNVMVSLGAALLGMGRSNEAVPTLELALAARPGHPETCFALAEAYRAAGRIEQAYDVAVNGLAANPDYLQGRMAMADALLDMGRHEDARAAFEDIAQRDPDDMMARGKLGAFHYHAGEFAEAEADLTAAISSLPDDVESQWHLAALYLSQRRWADGWPLYAWRWPMAKRVAQETLVDLPIWDGASLAGKRIVVWCEQGLGDELMFATCLADLLEQAAPEACVLTCDQRLTGLFQRSFPQITVLPMDKQSETGGELRVPQCDVQISAGDLPGLFRRRTVDFPSSPRSWTPEPVRGDYWRDRLAALGDGLKVGIAWRGGILERFRRAKSSDLIEWADILSVPKVSFINLQHGDCADELAAAGAALNCVIHDFGELDPIADPDDQMALISSLDLVIQTSNASAHMAGVLGVPVWNMVPFVPDWRWSLAGETCLWYPSMRLFRQPALGDWRSVLALAGKELAALVTSEATPEKG